jgi:hypothetical protein
MKYLALLLTLLPVVGQTLESPFKANQDMILAWENPDPLEEVVEWKVLVQEQPTPGTVDPAEAFTKVPFNMVGLFDIMKYNRNGVYRIRVIAVSKWNLESVPSDVIWIYWYGMPEKPKNITVRYKVLPTITPPIPN